jgi:hypothetical protein
MTEEDPPIWTLEDHLREGQRALLAVNLDEMSNEPQAVCHHFSEQVPIDPVLESKEQKYRHLLPIFATASIEFANDRLEGWERVQPSPDWLKERIPALFEIAAKHALIYEGWTWEPRMRQPIGACTFQVINNRT